jgi:hypothetical protein
VSSHFHSHTTPLRFPRDRRRDRRGGDSAGMQTTDGSAGGFYDALVTHHAHDDDPLDRREGRCVQTRVITIALFAWLISYQPAVLFSQNKPAPAINHQPNEQAACRSAVANIPSARFFLLMHEHVHMLISMLLPRFLPAELRRVRFAEGFLSAQHVPRVSGPLRRAWRSRHSHRIW